MVTRMLPDAQERVNLLRLGVVTKKSQRRTGHHRRSHIKNVSKHYVPRSMKNLLQILPIALCGLAGTAVADDFKRMVITSGMSADLRPIRGAQFMALRNCTQDDGRP